MARWSSFLALDVETANSSVASICQIGIAEAHIKGKVRIVFDALINPETHFDRANISIHGITEQKTKRAPTLPKVAHLVGDTIADRVVFSHTDFDKRALMEAWQRYSLPGVQCIWVDSRDLAREAWRIPSYKLADLAKMHGLRFEHHNAAEDARVCAQVVQLALAKLNIGLDDWIVDLKQYKPARRRRRGCFFFWR